MSGDAGTSKELLSALADGELAGAEPAAMCSAWQGDAELRRDWHAWHLIGDVLRSEDLAGEPGRDRAFCVSLRARLAAEPVVLAPSPLRPALAGTARPVRRWWGGAAVAAGVVLVAGAFVSMRPGETVAPRALAGIPAAGPVPAAPPPTRVAEADLPAEAIVADSRLIRDARLDRYLNAHKQFAGSSALGVPSAFLRSATVDSAQR